MKKLWSYIILLVSVIIFFSCNQQKTDLAEKEIVKDGIFIHVSHGSDNPHRVLMALSLAEKMSEDKDVILYFDITGIEVLLKDSPDLSFAHFTSSKEQVQKLLDKGITIMACPGCLKAAGKTPEDLREGIQVADKEKFFNFTDGRILSIDY
ncbi:MAG: DsrE family protein [Ignavibacteriaceae bacterium]|nr:DsrE family protein [Ignavibacteriaceae bacterium]